MTALTAKEELTVDEMRALIAEALPRCDRCDMVLHIWLPDSLPAHDDDAVCWTLFCECIDADGCVFEWAWMGGAEFTRTTELFVYD